MLVVTRKTGEAIRIGRDILVKVWHTPDGHIRVGIDAPRELPIAREELGSPELAKRTEARRA